MSWQLTGDTPAEHRLSFDIDDQARTDLETEVFGKRVLMTDAVADGRHAGDSSCRGFALSVVLRAVTVPADQTSAVDSGGGGGGVCQRTAKRRSRRLLLTTKTELVAIAAPAIMGFSRQAAASGRASRL